MFFRPDWLENLTLVWVPLLALLAGSAPRPRPLPLKETLTPGKGIFLVANPGLPDPRFRRTVVLLLVHDENGAAGLIINRATEIPLSEAVPDLKAPGKESQLLFFGGPVALNQLTFLTRTAQPPEGVTHVMADVYFSGDREWLQKLLEQKKNRKELRLYIGLSGWTKGQLHSEIDHGVWRLVQADPKVVFEKKSEDIWPDLSREARPRIDIARLPRFLSPERIQKGKGFSELVRLR
ncbi:MAG: YqgE/AlgH family protein [Acidobacteriota bacterium]